MNFISYLSDQIEKFAFFLNDIIITLFPFFASYLNNYPETIMIVIGFGGQALFAARFIIQWLSSESVGKSVIPIAFGIFQFQVDLFFLPMQFGERILLLLLVSLLGYLYMQEIYISSTERKKENKVDLPK